MTIRDGQPSPEQARKMARVFVIATLLGGLVVFLNVAMRSYNIRMQLIFTSAVFEVESQPKLRR